MAQILMQKANIAMAIKASGVSGVCSLVCFSFDVFFGSKETASTASAIGQAPTKKSITATKNNGLSILSPSLKYWGRYFENS